MPLRLAVDPRFQDRQRQPGLDLLRALAIIVVVIYHAALFGFKLPGRVDRFGLTLPRFFAIIVVAFSPAAFFGFKLPGRVDRFGWTGVDLFFVLSGYLIGGQLPAPPARNKGKELAADQITAEDKEKID